MHRSLERSTSTADGTYDAYRGGAGPTSAVQPEHLVSVKDGLGWSVQHVYAPITRQAQGGASPVYTPNPGCPGPGCTFPTRSFIGSKWVVTEEIVADPTGTFSLYHRYGDARIDVQGEGFLGFGRHIVTDSRNGAITQTRYDFTRTTRRMNGTTPSYRYPFLGTPTDVVAIVQDSSGLHTTHTGIVLREKCSSAGTGTFTYERARFSNTYAGPPDLAHPANPYGLLDDPEASFTGRTQQTSSARTTAVDAFGQAVQIAAQQGKAAEYVPAAPAQGCGVESDYVRFDEATDDFILTSITYRPVDTVSWTLGLPTQVDVASIVAGAVGGHTSKASYDSLGRLVEIIRDPSGPSGTDTSTGVSRQNVTYHRTKLLRFGTTGALGLPTTIIEAPDANDGGAYVRHASVLYDLDFIYPKVAINELGQTTT
jgi:hypothetical protein